MKKYFLPLLVLFCFSTIAFAEIFDWNGMGDGRNWDDPMNWLERNTLITGVPGVGDTAVITPLPASAPATVQIRNAQFAQSVEILMGSTLNIVSGSLTINNKNTGDGISIDDGNLNISEGAVVTIDSTFSQGINASGTVQINNAGTLNITNSVNEAIEADEFTINFNFNNTGILNITNTEDKAIQFEFSAVTVTVTFTNDGSITITNFFNEAILMEDVGTFTNNGTLTIIHDPNGPINGQHEAIDVHVADATFVNNGTINISGIEREEAIDISGTFINNCLINVANAAFSTDNAIQVKAGNGTLENTRCGVINVTSAHAIQNEGVITNNGIITTVFTGENDNDATFINNSVIASPNGIFRLEAGDNPILGFGSIRPDPIPAPFNFICAKGTPTLSQWGLIALALSMVIVGVLGIKQKSIVT